MKNMNLLLSSRMIIQHIALVFGNHWKMADWVRENSASRDRPIKVVVYVYLRHARKERTSDKQHIQLKTLFEVSQVQDSNTTLSSPLDSYPDMGASVFYILSLVSLVRAMKARNQHAHVEAIQPRPKITLCSITKRRESICAAIPSRSCNVGPNHANFSSKSGLLYVMWSQPYK